LTNFFKSSFFSRVSPFGVTYETVVPCALK
jgi:hypothetical protein